MFEIVMESLKQNRRDSKGLEQYRRSLRSPVRGLWQGVLTEGDFQDAMLSIIDRGLTRAFAEGTQECGISQDEWTQDEQEALAGIIVEEFSHVGDFGAAIVQNLRAAGGQLTPLFTRLEMWVNRYRDVQNEAKVTACKDAKLVWRLGATERSCRTCPRLDGKVKRQSVWEKAGVRPQNPPNPLIECGGWNCLCTLTVTDEPISKGPLPRLP